MFNRCFNYFLSSTIKNFLMAIATITLSTGTSLPAIAQIVPDESLGQESSVITPNVEVKGEAADRIDGGAIRDRNLFHSFQDFNVEDSQRVYFANPDNIEQIFTRITGSNPSNINGTLGVDGAADLLLLNPNGILFGENGSLDIEGSFFGTTADSVLFEDDAEFSAVQPNSSLLTVSVPLGIQIGDNPGNIEVRSPLEVPNGQNFSLVGGEINLTGNDVNTDDNGINSPADGIIAPGGRVELGGLLTAGIVNFNDSSNLIVPENVSKANINLDNYFVNASAGGGGSITLQSQNFRLTDSLIITGINSSVESTNAQAGNIIINTDEAAIIEASDNGQSVILNTTGDNITGDLSEFESSLINNNSDLVNNKGNAGNIFINADTLSMTDYSVIASATNSEGNAGNININAKSSVSLNSSEFFPAAIYSDVNRSGTGNGSDINIDTPSLSLKNADISTSTIGAGNAGNIFIDATNSVIARDSLIVAATFGSGNAGNIIFESETANLTFENQTLVGTPVGSRTSGEIFDLPNLSFVGTGEGENIRIKGRNLSVTNNSLIFTGTGGEVTADGLANAGNIELNISDSIEISGNSILSTGTAGEGNAGNINIKADEIRLIGNLSENIGTGIGATANDTGDGGIVNITVNNLMIAEGAGISVRSLGDGNAGSIAARVSNSVELNNGVISSFSDRSSGGEISIDAGSILLRGDSNILTNVANGTGGGGNITLSADSIVAFEDSDIVANSADGRGGNITLNTDAFFASPFNRALVNSNSGLLNGNSRVDINATGSVDGVIEIPEINFLPNNLVQLTEETIDAEDTIANSCVVRQGESGGTFIVTGSDGLSASPGDAPISNYATGSVRSIADEQATNSAKNNWQPGDPVIEPEKAYRLSNGKLVLSRECG